MTDGDDEILTTVNNGDDAGSYHSSRGGDSHDDLMTICDGELGMRRWYRKSAFDAPFATE